MMRVEPREEYPKVNIMLRSGTTTGEDKEKQPVEGEWVRKALERETGFDMERAKENIHGSKEKFR